MVNSRAQMQEHLLYNTAKLIIYIQINETQTRSVAERPIMTKIVTQRLVAMRTCLERSRIILVQT